jgi:hypothetical protein
VSIDATDREMGCRKDDIEWLNASLAELPELSNFEVSKQEAVRYSSRRFAGCRRRDTGWTKSQSWCPHAA